MPKVFISFVHEDHKVASAVQNLIASELVTRDDIFLSSDKTQVYAGDIWLDKIKEGLAASNVVVLLLSRRSVSRPWVNFEAGGAWLNAKPIIPVCFGSLTKDSLPQPYSGIQALNLGDEIHYLLLSLHRQLKLTTEPPTHPAAKALMDALDDRKNEAAAPGARLVREFLDPYKRIAMALSEFQDE